MRLVIRALRPVLAAVVALACASGCGATTGVDLEVDGADKAGGDQIVVSGGVVAGASQTIPAARMATLPDQPRALLSPEDLRIVFPDDQHDQIVALKVQLMKGGHPLGSAQTAMAILVEHITKRVCVCFDPSGTCSASACNR